MSGVPLEDGSVQTPLSFDDQLQDTEGNDHNTRLQVYPNINDRSFQTYVILFNFLGNVYFNVIFQK